MLIRLQKYLADCGLASRRKAEDLILAGQIKVNDHLVTQLGSKVDTGTDTVYFQDKAIKPKKNIYIMLNKPQGYTCTTRRFREEKNILELVRVPEKIFPVGRLDKETEGLVFLTNDGDWAYKLTHPKFEVEKEYEILLSKPVHQTDLDKMTKGVKNEGENLKIAKYTILSPKHVQIVLKQGHKREIRRLFAQFNYAITNLKRIRIANWHLGKLQPGQWQNFQP